MVLPHFSGRPIRVEIHPCLGSHWAATHIRQRVIQLDLAVIAQEFDRILIHELFHFVWVRLGNSRRQAWEQVLMAERQSGELGWSADLRKSKLTAEDRRQRSRRWREYACESFCDTAAWIYAGGRHPEYTLLTSARAGRRRWFHEQFRAGAVC